MRQAGRTPMRRNARRRGVAAIATFTVAALVLLVGSVEAVREDERLARCGGYSPMNKVLTSFEMPQARDFWKHFPHALAAPELQADTPAFVVVFDGPTTVTAMHAPDPNVDDSAIGVQPEVLDNVVCVYLPPSEYYPYGEMLVYANVSRQDFTP